MKNSLLVISTLWMIAVSSSCTNQRHSVDHIKQTIDSLSAIYVPDKRIAYSELEVISNDRVIVLKGETNLSTLKFKLLDILQAKGIGFQDSIVLLPHPDLGSKNFGLINASTANLRAAPGRTYEQVTQALMGTPVRIHKRDGEWYMIQTPDDYFCWTNQADIQLIDKATLDEWKQAIRVIYLADFGIIRSQNNDTARAVSDIVFGVILKRISKGSVWSEVELPDGRLGYIKNSECRDFDRWMDNITPDPEKMLKLAYELLGRPYFWGGTSIKGMDCSGFVKTLYYSAGIILPRDASQQVRVGELVDLNSGYQEFRKGDMLFFGRKGTNSQTERITHVAFYIGDGEFIHSSGRVKLNSLNPISYSYSEHLVDIFVKAKRIIGTSQNNPVSIRNHPWYN